MTWLETTARNRLADFGKDLHGAILGQAHCLVKVILSTTSPSIAILQFCSFIRISTHLKYGNAPSWRLTCPRIMHRADALRGKQDGLVSRALLIHGRLPDLGACS